MSSDVICLSRAVETIAIPSGEKIELPKGTEVVITQALGGTFTVVIRGQSGMVRIAGADADALGQEPVDPAESAPAAEGEADADAVWAQLKTCFDPEIPVNIVDLGLIYDLDVTPGDGGATVTVQMTLTAPGCGMGPSIASDAQHKILTLPGVKDASVDLVWDPPWTPDRISEDGKAKLGMA